MELHNQLNNINVFVIFQNQKLQLMWHINGMLKIKIKIVIT